MAKTRAILKGDIVINKNKVNGFTIGNEYVVYNRERGWIEIKDDVGCRHNFPTESFKLHFYINYKPTQSIEVLTYHQQWRLGVQEEAKYTPRQITIAIDEVLEYLHNIKTN